MLVLKSLTARFGRSLIAFGLTMLLGQSVATRTLSAEDTEGVGSPGGDVVLYEGNGGSQDIVAVYTDTAGQETKVDPNDEARSSKLMLVREGATITVFDDPDGSKEDDYCVIRVKKPSPEYTVNSFERSYEDEYVIVSYVRKNGLDGKVSRIKIE